MKTLPLASLSVLLVLASCKKDSATAADGGAGAPGSGSAAAADPAPTAMPALSTFEGEIDVTAKSKQSPKPISLAVLIKNDTVRVDVPDDLLADPKAAQFTGGGKVYAIMKTPQKKLFAVLDGKKQAIEVDLDQVGDQFKAMKASHGGGGANTPPADPPKVVKTGKKETVAGMACEDWEITNTDKSKAVLCVSEMGASFFHLPLTGIPTEHLWALELADGKHLPIKAVSFEKDGTESGRMEVTKVDKRTLDPAQFEVPAGYQVQTIQDAIAGLMGGAGVPPGTPLDIPGTPPHGGHGGHHHGHKPAQ
jgi:hypothetical protein